MTPLIIKNDVLARKDSQGRAPPSISEMRWLIWVSIFSSCSLMGQHAQSKWTSCLRNSSWHAASLLFALLQRRFMLFSKEELKDKRIRRQDLG
jgi:hypothetical protein